MARLLLGRSAMRNALLFVVVLSGCVGPSEVSMLGPNGPRKGCSAPAQTYETFPEGIRAIAIDAIPCLAGRDEPCMEQMQGDACRLGADVIAGLHHEQRWRLGTCLVGTLGTRSGP